LVASQTPDLMTKLSSS